MNKELTIVFSSYASDKLLEKILKRFDKEFKTIIIENSLNKKIKLYLERKFKNVTVIIPKQNLGLAKSYNLGIKKTKTKYTESIWILIKFLYNKIIILTCFNKSSIFTNGTSNFLEFIFSSFRTSPQFL